MWGLRWGTGSGIVCGFAAVKWNKERGAIRAGHGKERWSNCGLQQQVEAVVKVAVLECSGGDNVQVVEGKCRSVVMKVV